MTKAITLHLPDPVFKKAQILAAMHNQTLDDYLLSSIALPDVNIADLADTEAEVDAEEQAFRDLHPFLAQKYPGAYVAIAGGRLVDRDADQVELYRRVRQAYPERFVLIARVQAAPEEVYSFRSPRYSRPGPSSTCNLPDIEYPRGCSAPRSARQASETAAPRAVFDTNIFVSALLSHNPTSPTQALMHRWRNIAQRIF